METENIEMIIVRALCSNILSIVELANEAKEEYNSYLLYAKVGQTKYEEQKVKSILKLIKDGLDSGDLETEEEAKEAHKELMKLKGEENENR